MQPDLDTLFLRALKAPPLPLEAIRRRARHARARIAMRRCALAVTLAAAMLSGAGALERPQARGFSAPVVTTPQPLPAPAPASR